MKFLHTILIMTLIFCIAGSACAAANDTHTSKYGSDGGNHTSKTTGQSIIVTSSQSSGTAQAAAMQQTNAVMATNAVAFTSTPTTGISMDNSKKIAVYMPALTNPVYSETKATYSNLPVAFDPLTTAMLFEYNPDYFGDSSISSINVANYGLLIVPMCQMTPSAATAINNYISSGGSVWFMNDPCMTTSNGAGVQLSTLLGNGVASSVTSSTVIPVINTDDITSGLATSYKPVGTTTKSIEFRSLPAMSGTISGLNYQVLMGTNTKAMLVKFENPTNGARVIYSNPNMFISGGASSYFDAKTASKLFLQTKTWIMKLAQNPNGLQVSYPGSDKQFTITSDDEECMSWDQPITPMLTAETNAGISPSAVNTFFIIPASADMDKTKFNYYAANGDTHNLHPHNTIWDTTATTAATYQGYVTTNKGYINTLAGSSNYGFTSWRFPYTTFCTNSMQGLSNSGITIDSSWGEGTDTTQIGAPADNTVLLPKQMLINNAKVNLIEMEIPAGFDINYDTGTAMATAYNAYTNQFKNGNFPMNYVVAGHYQGIATNCGVAGWGVTSTGLTSGLTSIINAQKAANPKYSNFYTLSNYINGVKSAKISATVNGDTTTVTVTNSQAITGFTLKSALGNIISATCDGVSITPTSDSNTGAQYVTKDLSASTHTFVISTTPVAPPTPTQPTISFTATPTTITTGATVNFAASVTGYPTPTVTWNFGDSTTGTGTSVSHAFTNTGTTAITRTITTTANNGVGTPATYSVNVIVNPVTVAKPATKFTVSPTTGTTATTFTFTDTTTGTITSRLWNFGDGTTSAAASVTHKYATAKTYTVTLTDTNSAGSTAVSKSVVVSGSGVGTRAPTASFTYSPTTVHKGSTITFTDTSTQYPTRWKWTFYDNGAVVTTPVAKHAFTKTGSIKVTMAVYNAKGSNTATKYIRVVA